MDIPVIDRSDVGIAPRSAGMSVNGTMNSRPSPVLAEAMGPWGSQATKE
jgi:hypothetical protein